MHKHLQNLQETCEIWLFLKAIEELGKKIIISSNTIDQFNQAYATFKHQIIYCPINQYMRRLNESNNEYNFLGTIKDNSTAVAIATCQINPTTLTNFNSLCILSKSNEL
jgi:hypothetical protein